MKAGPLNKRITIERPVYERTATGAQRLAGWEPVISPANPQGRYWASVEPLRGREYYAAGAQIRADMDTRIIMRVQPSVQFDATMRATYKQVIYGFVSVANVKEAGDMLEITAKAGGVSDGR